MLCSWNARDRVCYVVMLVFPIMIVIVIRMRDVMDVYVILMMIVM